MSAGLFSQVARHLNDAMKNRLLDQQMAMERELPCSNGQIDLAAFMAALKSTGYEGPLTCKPMSATLNALDADEAAVQTLAAMKRAVALA